MEEQKPNGNQEIPDGTGITRGEFLRIGGVTAAIAAGIAVGVWKANQEPEPEVRLDTKVPDIEKDDFSVSFEKIEGLSKPELPEGVTEREFQLMVKVVNMAFEIYFNKLPRHAIPVNPKHVKRHLHILYEVIFKKVLESRKKGFKEFLERDLADVNQDPQKYTEYMNGFLRRSDMYVVADIGEKSPHVGIYSIMTQDRIAVNGNEFGTLLQLGAPLWTFGKERPVVERHPSNPKVILAWPERKEDLVKDRQNMRVADLEVRSEELFEQEKIKAVIKAFLSRPTNR